MLLLVKGEIRCKMDLGYVWYDKELECLFGSKKVHIDAFLSWLFLAKPKRYKLGTMGACLMVKTKSIF
jgi:hypothetical protein